MTWSEAGCVFMGFILCISGVQGQRSICALKGSSVNLLCSAHHSTSSMKWFTGRKDDDKRMIQNEVVPDGDRVSYKMSEKSRPTLTIKNLTESDENVYCCSKNADDQKHCRKHIIQLNVSDVQVKVIPCTEGQTVTLMCSTSCPLTEHPAGYIWYKNREFLYQDWSPWYQQLVSSEEAVTYSCAIRGYEDLRAPQVSVDSVTLACFTVTYAKGRMCPQTSKDEPCSITYPREVRVQRQSTSLTCNTSCPETDPEPAYRWYQNKRLHSESQQISVSRSSADSFSCAIKDFEDLLSDEFCLQDSNCLSVNYIRRRICALEGSSVNISSQYSHPSILKLESKSWYKIKRKTEKLIEAKGRVEYHDDNMKNHILRINDLKKDDSAEYTFRLKLLTGEWKESNFPGVTLVVTGLNVTVYPAEVTECQRVTLTCSTSCPLPDNTTYIWFFNSRPLTPTENQTKHLVLDPVSKQDTGNYSCSVETLKGITSPEETLTVYSLKVNFTPSAEVTEGQRVTLTCSTSCPLPDNTTYIWFFNSRPLTPTENQTELLVLDPVSSQHAGKYSCDVQNSTKTIGSSEKTLTVQNIQGEQIPVAAAAGVCAALLVIIILLVIIFWIRKKRTSEQSGIREATGNTEQLNPDHVYEDISAQPEEHEGLYYRVGFSKTHTDAFYSTVQPHEPRGQEHVAYDIVNPQPYTSPQ